MRKIKNVAIAGLILLSLALLIFCPITAMRVELNDGATKGICNVSIFTALSRSTIFIDNFTYTLLSNGGKIVVIAILQCVGLILTSMKRGYVAGIITVIVTWILLLESSLIIINVQSELFSGYGSVQQQTNSAFMLLILLPEIALVVFNGINHFRTVRQN